VYYVQNFTSKGTNHRITHNGDPVPGNDFVSSAYGCGTGTFRQYGPEYYITTNGTDAVTTTSEVCQFASGETSQGRSYSTYNDLSNGHGFYFLQQDGYQCL
jgi:hypothetical protein